MIAEYSKRVISFDLDPELKNTLGNRFANVDFVTGYSQQTLPAIIEDLNIKGQSPEFVLVDGDHSEHGVRDDVNLILKIKPQRPMVILMHDGFNPDCRRGMQSAAWAECPYAQYVDIDFVSGLYAASSYDTAEAGSMWSGLGGALLTPEPRNGDLVIRQSQQKVFESVEQISVHFRPDSASKRINNVHRLLSFLRPKSLKRG